LPKITSGPFHYKTYADSYLIKAKQFTNLPVKQAVIAVSAISLLYPQEGVALTMYRLILLKQGLH
jgi:5-methyltetrahydropteroyltriglutamate--homocysteine methyltransferase